MKFISTKRGSQPVSFLEAVNKGLAPDGGLYVPEQCPKLDSCFIETLNQRSFTEICIEVLHPFVSDEIDRKSLESLVDASINFDAVLKKLDDGLYVLELFHGPSYAFKDFGVRFMARLIARQATSDKTVLTATSGDTGAAVAAAFHGVPGTRAIILYPKGKISPFQEAQIANLGGNISAIEVEGTFDDCQKLVKLAFQDLNLRSKIELISANSINLGRLLPQIVYYFRAYSQIELPAKDLIFSVPSGNFGDLYAGLLAKKMGLKVRSFVAATNANDVVPRFLDSGCYEPRAVVETISNAMDIADPSNFARIRFLYGDDLGRLKREISGHSFSDKATKEAISILFDKYSYVVDPHGAVAYLALEKEMVRCEKSQGIFLETAHPRKFKKSMEEVLGASRLSGLLDFSVAGEKQSLAMEVDYDVFRRFISCQA